MKAAKKQPSDSMMNPTILQYHWDSNSGMIGWMAEKYNYVNNKISDEVHGTVYNFEISNFATLNHLHVRSVGLCAYDSRSKGREILWKSFDLFTAPPPLPRPNFEIQYLIGILRFHSSWGIRINNYLPSLLHKYERT